MTTDEIALIASGRSSNGGWIARCPAHNDRLPSLSIRHGRDGRTLVRCFAGCEPEAIARALGLSVADLFEGSDREPWRFAIRKRSTPQDIRDELRREAEATRRELVSGWHKRWHSPCECPPMHGRLLATEINSVRRSVAARLGVHLDPIAIPIYESGASMGCDRDPAWPAIYQRGLWCASIELLGEPMEFGDREPPRAIVHLADDIARHDMRDLEAAAYLEIQNGKSIPRVYGRELP